MDVKRGLDTALKAGHIDPNKSFSVGHEAKMA